jgi:DNA-binding PadR family transcriptional regulator
LTGGRDGPNITVTDITITDSQSGGLMGPTRPAFGRYAEPSLLILASLSDGPKHGYAMMVDIEAETGRPMGPGTLYAALVRLEEGGLVEALEAVDRRRPYRLTALGASTLTEQLRGLGEFARIRLRHLEAGVE